MASVFATIIYLCLVSKIDAFSVSTRIGARDLASRKEFPSSKSSADQKFIEAQDFERWGDFRKAKQAFTEAIDLFEKGETTMSDGDKMKVLGYSFLRLGFLHLDALGDAIGAVDFYKKAIAVDDCPSATSYEGLATAMEASGHYSLQEVKEAYALACGGTRRELFCYAVTLDRLGDPEGAKTLKEMRSRKNSFGLVDSWEYVKAQNRGLNNLSRGTRSMIEIALTAAKPLIDKGGLVCEFGVATGRSIRMTREMLPDEVSLHGFDTFNGLPEAWGNEPVGSYSCDGRIPDVNGDTTFHKGLFSETVGPFLASVADKPLAYANIDCDLYSSTMDILLPFADRIVPGTVLIFDEYICYPSWREDEFGAWQECCQRFGWEYEYLAFSLATKQAVVKVTKV